MIFNNKYHYAGWSKLENKKQGITIYYYYIHITKTHYKLDDIRGLPIARLKRKQKGFVSKSDTIIRGLKHV